MVEITLVKLSDELPFNIGLLHFVSFERRVRILKYKNEIDKKRSLIAELLIRKAAYEELDIPIEKVKISYNPYGKPFIDNVRYFKFNITHSGNYVAIAVSRYGVGIDIEKIENIDMGVAKRFFMKSEYQYIKSLSSETEKINAFYMLWTLKESYIKAIGKGLKIPLNSFGFNIDKDIHLVGQQIKKKYCFSSTKLHGYSFSVCSKELELRCKYIYVGERDIYNYYKNLLQPKKHIR